jgi:hypothetical protein
MSGKETGEWSEPSNKQQRNPWDNGERGLSEERPGQKSQQSFLKAVHDSLCDGIESLLGKSALDVLIEKYHLDKLTNAPQELHDQLSHIFGSGAIVLERIIVKELYNTCNLPLEDTEPFSFNFGERVNLAHRQFMIKTVWSVRGKGRAD